MTAPLDTDTELRNQILTEFKQVLKLAPADYTENCTNVVMSLIKASNEKTAREARFEGFLAGRNVHASELTQLDVEEALLSAKIHPAFYYMDWAKRLGLDTPNKGAK